MPNSFSTDHLKIAMLQMDVQVGDFNGTMKKIKSAYEKAEREGVDILQTPEAVLPGYPAWDLLVQNHFIERADQAVDLLREMTKGKRTALLLGHITFNPKNNGRSLINVASLFEDGKLKFRQIKRLLPTYDVFDDARYFEPGRTTSILDFRGFKIGILICEDWWYQDTHAGRLIYAKEPADAFVDKNYSALHKVSKIDLALSLSVSPFYKGKENLRESVHAKKASELRVPFVYVNSVGGVDHVQMDGSSFVMNSKGEVVSRLNRFQEDYSIVEISKDRTQNPKVLDAISRKPDIISEQEFVLKALIQGLRAHMKNIGQKNVVFGLSGGLDSALVAAVSVLALGPENVNVIMMPSEFSSESSILDAKASARNLGIPEANIFLLPIDKAYKAFSQTIDEEFARKGIEVHTDSFVPFENIQARSRMIFEYFVANRLPKTVKLNTSNKSEIAMGYSSMYGDSTGALALIGDLYKTEARELAIYLNQMFNKELIPWSTIHKKYSAELRPNQITENELPPYTELDPLLRDLMENGLSPEELHSKYTHKLLHLRGPDWVEKVLRTFHAVEWKRNQAPFSIKVSRRAYGIGRRVPISGIKFQTVESIFSCRDLFR